MPRERGWALSMCRGTPAEKGPAVILPVRSAERSEKENDGWAARRPAWSGRGGRAVLLRGISRRQEPRGEAVGRVALSERQTRRLWVGGVRCSAKGSVERRSHAASTPVQWRSSTAHRSERRVTPHERGSVPSTGSGGGPERVVARERGAHDSGSRRQCLCDGSVELGRRRGALRLEPRTLPGPNCVGDGVETRGRDVVRRRLHLPGPVWPAKGASA